MYEDRRHRPLPANRFRWRIVRHAVAALALIAGSLAVGMWGYSHYEGLEWRDAFLNATMLLGGMGPVNPPKTDDGKVFAGLYALYCGIVFLVVAGLLLVPFVHRLLHKFHWEAGGD